MIASKLQLLEARAISSFSFRTIDLAIFRIIYASFILLTIVPIAAWLPLAPHAFFYPPVGPAALFTGTPSPGVLLTLNILLTLFTSMLLIGWKTRVASAGTGLTILVLNSWLYSLGKIVHDILIVIVPLVLGFSSWGQALSVDKARGELVADGEGADAWPLALLALLIGFAMFTAGRAKASNGWLDPQLKCTFGFLVTNYLFIGRDMWAARMALKIDSVWIWKLADWSTVLLEVAFLPASFHRRAFCVVIVVATLFHTGILFVFGIQFAASVIAYGAFVRYSAWPCFKSLDPGVPLSRSKAVIIFMAAVLLGLVTTMSGKSVASLLNIPIAPIVVCLGALVSVGYIVQALQGSKRRSSVFS